MNFKKLVFQREVSWLINSSNTESSELNLFLMNTK